MYTLRRRVYFYETDAMQVAHHANCLRWLEEARVEYLRRGHISLNELMDRGVVCPIVEVRVRYLKPAVYDDILLVHTYLRELDRAKIVFEYDVCREQTGEVLYRAYTKGTFMDKKTGRIQRLPAEELTELQAISKEDRA